MNVMRTVVLLLVLAGGLMSGCATIIHGTTQEIPVTSEPPGALVATTGDLKVTTPGTLELKRKTGHVLTVTKDGYKPETVKLESVLSGAVAGNILLGGLIGWGVDVATGGDSRLVPESVHAILKPHDPVSVVLVGPPGAEVHINEQNYILDLTGVLPLSLRPGPYPMVMRKLGFEPWNEALTVEPEKPIRREVSLTPVKEPSPPATSEGSSVGAQPTAEDPKNLEKRLQTLKDLREKNLITEEQYQTATSELLKKLTQ
jgi:hypothetical protein